METLTIEDMIILVLVMRSKDSNTAIDIVNHVSASGFTNSELTIRTAIYSLQERGWLDVHNHDDFGEPLGEYDWEYFIPALKWEIIKEMHWNAHFAQA